MNDQNPVRVRRTVTYDILFKPGTPAEVLSMDDFRKLDELTVGVATEFSGNWAQVVSVHTDEVEENFQPPASDDDDLMSSLIRELIRLS